MSDFSETVFHFRINGGDVQTIAFATGIYMHAAAGIVAVRDLDIPAEIEIWHEPHLPLGHGPYFFRAEYDRFVALRVAHVIRPHSIPPALRNPKGAA